jgi:phage recombination protein Bet
MEAIMNDVATIEPNAVPTVSWTSEQVELIKRTIAVGATMDELQLFLYQAKRTGLDPLSRQIHFVKRKDKGTIQTAIDGYRLIADRTGKYAGSDDYLFDEGIPQYLHMIGKDTQVPVTATVTVYKMCDGMKVAFTATAGWSEYCPSDEKSGFMWRKMPYLMIGKCAEALALRKAFPAELSGIYTNEEMMQSGTATPSTTHQGNGSVNEKCVPNYGPDAGQPFSAVKTDHLQDYLAGMERSIKDPKKANFLRKNEEMRDALKAEILAREEAKEQGAQDGVEPAIVRANPQEVHDAAPPSLFCAYREQISLSQSVSECSATLNTALKDETLSVFEVKTLQDEEKAKIVSLRKAKA